MYNLAMHQYELLKPTSAAWTAHVLANFDDFMLDHAACEKKAASTAMSLVAHYPDKPKLVSAMIELAIEELAHFREMAKHIYAKDLTLGKDEKDLYVNRLLKQARQGSPEHYLLDRLLIASIIERRGHERFAMVAEALPEGKMKQVYTTLAKAEGRHYELFLALAHEYLPDEDITGRLQSLLAFEADLVDKIPIRAAVH